MTKVVNSPCAASRARVDCLPYSSQSGFINKPSSSQSTCARTRARLSPIHDAFWNESRGLVADTVSGDAFSEHAQVLALTSRVLPPDKAKRAFEGLVSSGDLAPCTVYFMHYLFDVYFAFGRADLFLQRMDTWREFVAKDLKTPLEAPGDARSDCHGWGSHPLYHFQTGLAGVRPAAPGFEKVRVAPCPGPLGFVRSCMPHPRGQISVDLKFADGGVSGSVSLPQGVTGVFSWAGRESPLAPGENDIESVCRR